MAISPKAEAVLDEPKAGAVSSDAAPGADSSKGSAPEQEFSESPYGKVHSGSEILARLTSAQYRHWQRTGDLPDDKDIPDKRGKAGPGANEKVLRQLSAEERKTWRETGNLPERFSEESKAAAAKEAKEAKEKAGESKHELAEVDSPLARLNVMNADKDKAAGFQESAETIMREFPDRLKTDTAKYTADERTQIGEAWMKVAGPQIYNLLGKDVADKFLGVLNKAVRPFLHAPYSFWRELSINEAFRRDLLNAGFAPGGNWNKVISVIAKFDAEHAPEPVKRVSSAPEPATSFTGKHTAPVDVEDGAARDGDFRTFMAAANRKDYNRRRGL